MNVVVDPPVVVGDTVAFSWSQDQPNPYQLNNSFFFRYEGIDLSRFSDQLWMEIFLALQLRVFNAWPDSVNITLPVRTPHSTIQFWKAFHQAQRCVIEPVASVVSYSPWVDEQTSSPFSADAAVFYGGGKDSTCAASLLGEAIGADRTVLMHFIAPWQLEEGRPELTERRSTTLMLEPLRRNCGFQVQRGWTDVWQNYFPKAPMRLRPNLEIYTAGFLPAMLAWGVNYSTFGHAYSVFSVKLNEVGEKQYRFRQSRPEMLSIQSRHYRNVLGLNTTVSNLNLLLTGLLAFGILVQRFPEAARLMVMCTQSKSESRFCYHCKKCTMYAWYSLFFKFVDPEFDYDRQFAQSRSVKESVAFIRSDPARDESGNYLEAPGMQFVGGYQQLVTAIHGSDIGQIRELLSSKALENIAIIKAGFGVRAYNNWRSIPGGVVETINHPYAWKVLELLKHEIELVEPFPDLVLPNGRTLRVEFPGSMLTGAENLPHLQKRARQITDRRGR